jgi:hypothetical protein
VFRLSGGTEDNDLWVERTEDAEGNPCLCSVWVPTMEERLALADEANNVYLITWGTGTPPLAMGVTNVPLGKKPGDDG